MAFKEWFGSKKQQFTDIPNTRDEYEKIRHKTQWDQPELANFAPPTPAKDWKSVANIQKWQYEEYANMTGEQIYERSAAIRDGNLTKSAFAVAEQFCWNRPNIILNLTSQKADVLSTQNFDKMMQVKSLDEYVWYAAMQRVYDFYIRGFLYDVDQGTCQLTAEQFKEFLTDRAYANWKGKMENEYGNAEMRKHRASYPPQFTR